MALLLYGLCETGLALLPWVAMMEVSEVAMSPTFASLASVSILALAVGSLGCSSSTSGGQAGGQTGGETAGCIEKTSTPVAPDETSPIGKSPNEVQALAAGPLVADGKWAKDGSAVEVTVSTSFGGEARYVTYELADDGSGTEPALMCDPALLVKVTLDFTTSDGAFADSFATVLTTTQAGTTEWGSIDLTKLAGSYTVTEVDPAQYDAIVVYRDLAFDGTTVTGAITGQAQRCEGSGDSGTCSAENFAILDIGTPQ